MFGLEVTADDKQVLQDTTIDAEQPGPILHDFEVVLEFVKTEDVKAGGKYNLLPITAIPILDERLSRPLRLNLKRPQLKSHPYLQGLHLLLRATGLTMVEGSGDKARLRVNAPVLEQWERLNPTEQFFTLVEATFLHADGAMIGEPSRAFDASVLTCLGAWNMVPKKGKHLDLSRFSMVYGMYGKSYLLALCDLFGLWRVELRDAPVVPWMPHGVYHTPFGDAFFTLMSQQELDDLTPDEVPAFGAWRKIFTPYFPEWRENLVASKPEWREGVFVFKVSLGNVWRQIAIPDSLTLDNLADAILSAVEFDSDHLYEFSFRDQWGGTARINHPQVEEGPWTDEFPIGELPLQPGQSMTFLFDYGDNWKFNVKLEKIEPPNPRMKTPKLLAQHGAAPEQYPNAEW